LHTTTTTTTAATAAATTTTTTTTTTMLLLITIIIAVLFSLYFYRSVKHKASVVMDSIAKLGKITPALEWCIRCARSISELDHIVSKTLNVYTCCTFAAPWNWKRMLK
jgi:hypothetical protein